MYSLVYLKQQCITIVICASVIIITLIAIYIISSYSMFSQGPNADSTEQAEALSQAVNLMNQMGMGPIISSMFGAQGLLCFVYIKLNCMISLLHVNIMTCI